MKTTTLSHTQKQFLGSSILLSGLAIALLLTGCSSEPEYQTPQRPIQLSLPPSDPKPATPVGQCRVVLQDEAKSFQLMKSQLIGKRYVTYSKIKKDSTPQGPYSISSIAFRPLTSNGTWGEIQINGSAVDIVDIYVETTKGSFDNLLLTQGEVFKSKSCPQSTLVYRNKIILN